MTNLLQAQLTRTLRQAITCAIFMSLSASPVLAAGVALREGSADWTANAFAGETAKAYDASTAASNPAGLTRLDLNETDLSISLIAPSSSFSGTNTFGLGLRTPGSQGGHPIEPAVVPGFFGVWNFSHDLKFGMALSAPFGQRIAYSGDFVGRYQSLVSSISQAEISLSAGYRINQHLSVGGGPVIGILSLRQTQAVNLGALNARFGDPIADFHGGDVGVGFTLGALYEFDESFRVGITYRSRIQHTVAGIQSVTFPAALAFASPATAGLLLASAGSASTRLTLPDTVSVGFYKQIDERWAVMADLQWTDWSLIDTIAVTPDSGAPATVLHENWRNTWFGAAGANFRPTSRLLLQAGLGYDASPVTDGNRTTRVPDSNRFLVAGGVTYNLLAGVNLQFAVLQMIASAGRIDNSASPAAGTIRGTYHIGATVVSLGVVSRF